MAFKFRIACAALLVLVATPALAFKLGRIQVKSALNQPLVAAIPVHPENLSELEGLHVGLAPASDFKRVGLKLTSSDRQLQFRVVTNDNGQTVILVTSARPVTSPYLDFLIQVRTRRGKQMREYVALLNPVTMAPVQPVVSAPAAAAPEGAGHQARQQPPATAAQHVQAPTHPQAQPSGPASGPIHVVHGDTLYGIASNLTRNSDMTVNQMMLALKATNPDAFYKNNINDLSAGAILRVPARDQVQKISVATANAEVRRQYAAWRAAKPHPAKVLAGKAAEAATTSAPAQAGHAPTSDHLALVAPTAKGGAPGSKSGAAAGTGAAGLKQRLQNDHGTLISLKQSSADLESRVQSLKDIAGQSDKLLGLKAATLADLQHKLAAVAGGKQGVSASGSAVAKTVGTGAGAAVATASTSAAPTGSAAMKTKMAATAVAGTVGSAAASAKTATAGPGAVNVKTGAAMAAIGSKAAVHPANSGNATHAAAKHAAAKHARKAGQQPWYMRPMYWLIAALIVLVLILLGLSRRKRKPKVLLLRDGPVLGPEAETAIPAPGPEAAATVSAAASSTAVAAAVPDAKPDEAALYARLKQHPEDLGAHLQLCRLYYERLDADRFVESAEAMHEELKYPDCREWREVKAMGAALAPRHSLFADSPEIADAPRASEVWYRPTEADADTDQPSAAAGIAAAGALAAGGLAAYEFESQPTEASTDAEASKAPPRASEDSMVSPTTTDDVDASGLQLEAQGATEPDPTLGEALDSDAAAAGAESEAPPPRAVDYLEPLEFDTPAVQAAALAAEHYEVSRAPVPAGESDTAADTASEMVPLEFESWSPEAPLAEDEKHQLSSAGVDTEPEVPPRDVDDPEPADVEAQRPDTEDAVPPDMRWEQAPAHPASPVADGAPAAPEPAVVQTEGPSDPVNIKLELARAYLDMGDTVGAHALLHEVIEEGSPTQQNDARHLLAEAGASD